MHTRLLISVATLAAPTPTPISMVTIDYNINPSVHVIISAAGSVQMQGRNSPAMAWTNIGAAYTATGFYVMPNSAGELQAVLTGNTGTVSVAIAY